jgi:hypothetical protein
MEPTPAVWDLPVLLSRYLPASERVDADKARCRKSLLTYSFDDYTGCANEPPSRALPDLKTPPRGCSGVLGRFQRRRC